MTPKQLTLAPDRPTIVTVDRLSGDTYYLIRVTEKDAKTPAKRAHMALGMYEGRHLHRPREIKCHPNTATELGPDVMGVQVIVMTQCQPDDFWLGPKEA